MLASANRLTGPGQFASVVRHGVHAGQPAVVVHLLRADPSGPNDMSPQVGFIVSKAVGNAVTRNLVKRRLRDIMRSLLKEPALSGAESQHTWIVIRANKHAATAAYNELFTDVWTAILKARRRDVARHATLAATGGMP